MAWIARACEKVVAAHKRRAPTYEPLTISEEEALRELLMTLRTRLPETLDMTGLRP
jgi:hypothetical protein